MSLGQLLTQHLSYINTDVCYGFHDLFVSGSSLKVVANMSEDTDNIDVAECKSRGIKIVTLPQVSSNSVVDLAVELLKKASRRWLRGIIL